MSALTTEPSTSERLSGGHLPRSMSYSLGATIILLAYLWALVGDHSYALAAVLGGLLYIVAIYVISRIVEGRRHAADRLWQALIYSAFIIAIAPLLAILGTVVVRGIKVLSVEFLTTSMRNVSPRDPGGGVYHALIGTIEQVLLAAAVGVPIGIMVAIYLVEYARTGRLRTSITFFVDVMTGIPSIVAGLFIYTWFVLTLGFERSGFAGSLALAILLIPVVVRTTEEMLRIVPNELREASFALGVPKWRTIVKIVLPTALTGIITGVMLAVARVAGETAPLLLTTFLSQSINSNPFADPQASIPTFVWDQIASGTNASLDRAWAGALVLILFVVILNVAARLIARFSRVSA